MKSIVSVALNSRVGKSKHFFWYEFLCLSQWRIFCFPARAQVRNLEEIVLILEKIREILGNYPLTITSGVRPSLYNIFIGGSKWSKHRHGKAADFSHPTMTADRVRQVLLPHLEGLGICMEDLPGSDWIHVDTGAPRKNSGRFFRP